jgi:hypothetical protein
VGLADSTGRQAAQAGHLGLAKARKRLEDVGGVLEIATRADGEPTPGSPSCPAQLIGRTVRAENANGLGAKPPRPFVGRMFYYVLGTSRLPCISSRKQHSDAVAAASGGEGGLSWVGRPESLWDFNELLETSASRRSFSLSGRSAVGGRDWIEQPLSAVVAYELHSWTWPVMSRSASFATTQPRCSAVLKRESICG